MAKRRHLSSKLKEQLNQKSIKYNWHDAELTMLEGVFARGDRKLCALLEEAYRNGCIFDSWSEYFNYDAWMKSFEQLHIDMDFYNHREREKEEILPWDFIDVGVTKEFLWREYQKGQQETVTPNCRKGCAGCGAKVFHGGVCYEPRNEAGESIIEGSVSF